MTATLIGSRSLPSPGNCCGCQPLLLSLCSTSVGEPWMHSQLPCLYSMHGSHITRERLASGGYVIVLTSPLTSRRRAALCAGDCYPFAKSQAYPAAAMGQRHQATALSPRKTYLIILPAITFTSPFYTSPAGPLRLLMLRGPLHKHSYHPLPQGTTILPYQRQNT